MIRFLLLLGCLLTTPVYAGNNTCSEHQCMAVVDAGSTGSRLHIFSYDLDETNTPIHISEIWVKKPTQDLQQSKRSQTLSMLT